MQNMNTILHKSDIFSGNLLNIGCMIQIYRWKRDKQINKWITTLQMNWHNSYQFDIMQNVELVWKCHSTSMSISMHFKWIVLKCTTTNLIECIVIAMHTVVHTKLNHLNGKHFSVGNFTNWLIQRRHHRSI